MTIPTWAKFRLVSHVPEVTRKPIKFIITLLNSLRILLPLSNQTQKLVNQQVPTELAGSRR